MQDDKSSSSNQSSLAERCYSSELASEELFDTLNSILGSRPLKECLETDYVFMCRDSWTDHYDGSVEVILDDKAPEITGEIASKILALGFSMIYFSRGNKCDVWTTSKGPCEGYSVREGDDEQNKLRKYRHLVDQLKANNESLCNIPR